VKEPDCLDAVLLAKQVDRRLDKIPSVWIFSRDVVATVDSTKVALSVFSLTVRGKWIPRTNLYHYIIVFILV
jgi:hypothetical protein